MKPVASPPRPNCTRSTTPRSTRSSPHCSRSSALPEALELAAIIAPLDPGNAVAQFRAGYTLQMASRHADAIAPDRQPRFGEWEPALEEIARDLRAGGAASPRVGGF
ncbi:hypothetical protein OKW45_006452 [Paraburkholderia sp. WSM4175]|uniref:hypothetical protein n=1 Tax=Paraburkholderia sp. WSM4175 TaxID=2991072 RepID=UPI003D20FF05